MVSSEVELKELKLAFERMDKNGDGILSKNEILDGLNHIGFNDLEEFNILFKSMDMNDNGSIEYTEFLAAMIDHKK